MYQLSKNAVIGLVKLFNLISYHFEKRIVLILLILSVNLGFSQEEEGQVPKRIYTTKIILPLTAPVIDGTLSEECWSKVEWADEFV